MDVIVDSNILVSLQSPASADAMELRRLVEFDQVCLVIPKLALDEFEAKVSAGIASLQAEVQRACNKSQIWLGPTLEHPFRLPSDLECIDFARQRRLEWEQLIHDEIAQLADYPSVSHENIVARCLSRKRPFQATRDDQGFRDVLIWETTLELARKTTQQAVLISSDKKAFAADDSEELHPDLRNEAETAGLAPYQLLFFTSVTQFIDSMFGSTTPMDFRVLESDSDVRKRVTDVLFGSAVQALASRTIPLAISETSIAGIDLVLESLDECIGLLIQTAATRVDGDHSLSGEMLLDGSISFRPIPQWCPPDMAARSSWVLDADDATDFQRSLLETASTRARKEAIVAVQFSAVFDPDLATLRHATFTPVHVDDSIPRDWLSDELPDDRSR